VLNYKLVSIVNLLYHKIKKKASVLGKYPQKNQINFVCFLYVNVV